MRFTTVTLAALFCLGANAATIDQTSDEAIVQAAEKMMAQDAAKNPASVVTASAATAAQATTASTTAVTSGATETTKESDIPLFLENKKSDKGMGSVVWRLLASLGLVAVVGGALIYASRRWSRTKDKGGSKARIEMLHQFHMGPRKSLALVRVAGEVMLIGVTDHAINMIKPVTLIDDEVEGLLNKDFNNFLEDEFAVEDVRTALGARV